jgi:hypothetical protein
MMVSAAASSPVPGSDNAAPPESYGTVAVSRLVRIDANGTLFCDIDDFPPVIGKNIPVALEGVEIPADGAVDKDVIAFLEKTLTPKAADAIPAIVLKNIRRGQTFCLIADIEIDGKDLARMLIDNGLARRIIRLAADEHPAVSPASSAPAAAPSKSPVAPVSYVAAKTSKVFHLSTCPHAKRLNQATAITFPTRQAAEQNGRRPCKTCNP